MTLFLATACVAAYVLGSAGIALAPWPIAAVSLAAALSFDRWSAGRRSTNELPRSSEAAVLAALGLAVGMALLWPVSPSWLPPGGASDLTHHLMLVDVIERTRHLVGAGSEAALGEMAHYTPGLHLLIVLGGSMLGVEAYRVAYPLLVLSMALKATFLYRIARDAQPGVRARVPLAISAVGFVLFAPRAYSLDGVLQAGFFAQVASELFVVAGWWGLSRWRMDPSPGWMVFVGMMGAAVFLVWPIWVGPLMFAALLIIALQTTVARAGRVRALVVAAVPFVLVAALHLSRHAAWLRMAGTSGAVPVFAPGLTGVALMALALAGMLASWRNPRARSTLWMAAGIALQTFALYALARFRGAETPYMAMKMIYLAVYPAAVLASLALGAMLRRWSPPSPAGAWLAVAVVLAIGVRAATAAALPPPIVSLDLDAAGRWARANLDPACVDYIVRDAEQAYWLHLSVMGQPRSSERTAELDSYTANSAVGKWIERRHLPYAIAEEALLPGEVQSAIDVVYKVGGAVVVASADAPRTSCALPPPQ